MLLPLVLLVIAKVALERLLAPWALGGVCDRREGRNRLVFAWVAEELGWSVYFQENSIFHMMDRRSVTRSEWKNKKNKKKNSQNVPE